MAGTNRTELAKSAAGGGGPAVILVQPQMGENIGAAARAMLNCGLTDLRLVNPRDGWPNEKADAASSGATLVLEGVRVYDTTEAAIADLTHVYATTARPRDMVKRVLTARRAAEDMRAHWAADREVGILFGPERTGLHNDDLTLADTLITVPLNPGFASLNLAQAVLLVGHEWFTSGDESPEDYVHLGGSRPATKDELTGLFAHLEAELDETGFYTSEEKRPSMVRNVRNTLQRAMMTEQEVRTFHGIIKALVGLKAKRVK